MVMESYEKLNGLTNYCAERRYYEYCSRPETLNHL